MIVMALIALFGLVGITLLYFFFVARGAALRANVHAEMEEEVALKQRKAQGVESDMVKDIVSGKPVDQALAEYQERRAGIVTTDKTENAWAWTGDDLDAWKKRETRRRIEENNRRVLLPAVASSALVVTMTLVSIVVYYQFMSGQNGASSAVPTFRNGPSMLPTALPPVRTPDVADPLDAKATPTTKASDAPSTIDAAPQSPIENAPN